MAFNNLTCCLCNYGAKSELDLESHINSNHADIFHTADSKIGKKSQQNLFVSDVSTLTVPVQNSAAHKVIDKEIKNVGPPTSKAEGSKIKAINNDNPTLEGQKEGHKMKVIAEPLKRNRKRSPTTSNGDSDLIQKKTRENGENSASKESDQILQLKCELDKVTCKLNASESLNETLKRKLARFDKVTEDLSKTKNENKKLIKNHKTLIVDLSKVKTEHKAMSAKLAHFEEIKEEFNLSRAKTEQLTKELSTLTEEEESLKKDFAEAEARNSDLELKLLIATNEQTSAKESAEELKNILKAKATELTRTKLSEGRLQIEANKMRVDTDKIKNNYDSLQAKFVTIMGNYANYKADSDRYDIVRVAVETVYKKDSQMFQTESEDEPFRGLDENQVCDTIRQYILDSYDAYISNYNSNSILLQNKTSERKLVFREMIERLEKQTDLLKKFKSKNEKRKRNLKIEIAKRLKSSEEHLATVEKLNKEKEASANNSKHLKEELQLLEAQFIAKTKITDNLKLELEEFDQLIKATHTENDELKNQNKQIESNNVQLILELNDANQLMQMLQEQHDRTSKENEECKVKISELISVITDQKQLITTLKRKQNENNDCIIQDLKLELSQMEEIMISFQEKNEELTRKHEDSSSKNDHLKNELIEIEKVIYTLQEKQKKCMQDCEDKISQVNKEFEESKLNHESLMHKKEEQMRSKVLNNEALKKEIELLQNLQDPDVVKLLQEKSVLEEKFAELEKHCKTQEADFAQVLENHNETLTTMKNQVSNNLTEKALQMDTLKEQLDSLRSEVTEKNSKIEKLKSQMFDMMENILGYKSRLEEQMTRNLNLEILHKQEKDKNTKELTNSKELAKSLKKELVEIQTRNTQLRNQAEKMERHDFMNIDDGSLPTSSKRKQSAYNKLNCTEKGSPEKELLTRKQVMIATLEKDVLEKSDKLATLERERETYQESMSWANKHCSEMNQKIKQLENELSKYQPYSTESYQQVQIFGQPCIKEEIIIKEEFGS